MEFFHSGKARKLRDGSTHDFSSTGSNRAIQHNPVVCGDESAVCDVINSRRGSNVLVDVEHRIVLCAIRVAFPAAAETDAFLKIQDLRKMTQFHLFLRDSASLPSNGWEPWLETAPTGGGRKS